MTYPSFFLRRCLWMGCLSGHDLPYSIFQVPPTNVTVTSGLCGGLEASLVPGVRVHFSSRRRTPGQTFLLHYKPLCSLDYSDVDLVSFSGLLSFEGGRNAEETSKKINQEQAPEACIGGYARLRAHICTQFQNLNFSTSVGDEVVLNTWMHAQTRRARSRQRENIGLIRLLYVEWIYSLGPTQLDYGVLDIPKVPLVHRGRKI